MNRRGHGMGDNRSHGAAPAAAGLVGPGSTAIRTSSLRRHLSPLTTVHLARRGEPTVLDVAGAVVGRAEARRCSHALAMEAGGASTSSATGLDYTSAGQRCTICLDTEGEIVQRGCYCRGDGGAVHLPCLIQLACYNDEHHNWLPWVACGVCKGSFTGDVQLGLAEACYTRFKGRPKADEARLFAVHQRGVALRSHTEFAAAVDHFREVHEIRMATLGPENPKTLTSADNLATTLLLLDQTVEAETMLVDALTTKTSVLGPEHADTLASADSLARAYLHQGKHDHAETLLKEVLAAKRRVLGEEHTATLGTALNLAEAYRSKGKHRTAESLQRSVLDRMKRVLGEEHPETLYAGKRMSLTYIADRRFADAEVNGRDVLAKMRRVFGSEHPSTLIAACSLAGTFWIQGKEDEAKAFQPELRRLCRLLAGNPDALATITSFIDRLDESQRPDVSTAPASRTPFGGPDASARPRRVHARHKRPMGSVHAADSPHMPPVLEPTPPAHNTRSAKRRRVTQGY
eukprot:m.59523 g.59523  ORF g.59523 m.59523 type:complete len:517 (-) comp7898_c0_seq1:272-1822(-)